MIERLIDFLQLIRRRERKTESSDTVLHKEERERAHFVDLPPRLRD